MPGLIATLTLNPALDLWTSTERVIPEHKLRCDEPRFDPGGGGINVARAVTQLGGDALAVFPAGGPSGAVIDRLLSDAGIPHHLIPIPGWTRQSVTVQESASGAQFRFVLPGPGLSADDQEACLGALAAIDPAPAFVVLSGSMPPGVDEGFLNRLGDFCRSRGARLAVDTSGEALDWVHGACILKPSLRELAALVGRPLDTLSHQLEATRQVIHEGRAEIVALSLGAQGALLVTATSASRYFAPTVKVESAVGAGDAMLAGILVALAEGRSLPEAACYGVAAGSAALLHPGTGLCTRADTERLVADVHEAALAA